MQYSGLANIANEHGNDFYLFDEQKFTNNFKTLLGAFRKNYRKTDIGYSYKTNYTPFICRLVSRLGGFAEVVSEMEYALARKLSVPHDKIIYNGPYKSSSSLFEALTNGSIVNLDSEYDLQQTLDLARSRASQEFEVALRCNFDLDNGQISRFGFDVEGKQFSNAIQAIQRSDNLKLSGLHCHFPDRNLESYRKRASKLIALCTELFPSSPPRFLNIGGGYFGELPQSLIEAHNLTPVSYEQYAATIGQEFAKSFGGEYEPQLFIEPGTALVADTMSYFAKTLSVKQVRGSWFATISGSIFNISPVARNTNLPFKIYRSTRDNENEVGPTSIVGFTCIEGDQLSKPFVAKIAPDDFVGFSNVGSYSIVMKPPFILPASPILKIDENKKIRVLKARESMDYVFQNFNFEILP